MSNVAKSFAQLVKYNNGMFKSDKQAKFLLSQLDYVADGSVGIYYSTADHVWGNGYSFAYTCDATGVVKVQKLTRKATKTVWERDTTNGWQDVNNKREAQRLRAAWINKAHDTLKRCDAIIYNKLSADSERNDLNLAVLKSMTTRRSQLEEQLMNAHTLFQQGYTA